MIAKKGFSAFIKVFMSKRTYHSLAPTIALGTTAIMISRISSGFSPFLLNIGAARRQHKIMPVTMNIA